MTTTAVATSWFLDSLRSPCCGTRLEPVESGVVCASCGGQFPQRPYGLDLVPSDIDERFDAYEQWTQVQAALAGWRARTWNQSEDAEARTRETHRMAAAFLDLTGVHGKVLDIGCGSGWIAEVISAHGGSYAGVDPTPLNASYAFPFVRGVSDNLPLADGICDTALFFSSLDYSLDVQATLAEARRVLAPGGRIAIATPVHATKEASGERLHCYRFLAGEVARELSAAFGTHAETHEWRPNYHFVWTVRP